MDSSILRFEENGVEYFTVAATGESGLSGSGIGRSLGVSQQAISLLTKIIQKSVTSNELPESLKPLWGTNFYLQAKYKNAMIYSSDAWACFAEYYAFEAKKTTKEAISVYRSFARIGAAHYIQIKTGWTSREKAAASVPQKVIDNVIMDSPDPWQLMFDEERNKAFAWFGHWFYTNFVYCFFTKEEWEKINAVNPIRREDNGRCDRAYRIHQFIEPETKKRLRKNVIIILAYVDMADTPEEFVELYEAKFSPARQLRLRFKYDQ